MFKARGVSDDIELMPSDIKPLGKLAGTSMGELKRLREVRLESTGRTVPASRKVELKQNPGTSSVNDVSAMLDKTPRLPDRHVFNCKLFSCWSCARDGGMVPTRFSSYIDRYVSAVKVLEEKTSGIWPLVVFPVVR
jgi:hypothetical protein